MTITKTDIDQLILTHSYQ